MTPAAVTDALLHDLVACAHGEGITSLAVACSIDHHDRILLIVEPGVDFIDHTWQLPSGPVLPGETLTDALPKALASIGLDLDEVIGYLGHHNHLHNDDEPTRVFSFAVTVTDPHSICQAALIGHRWAELDDLADAATPPGRCGLPSPPGPPANLLGPDDSPLATALRADARGLRAAEAGTELLIRHASWLNSNDLRDRFLTLHPTITGDCATATIDWAAAIAALDAGELPCASGEARMLRLAASLIHGVPVNLNDALIGLDNHNLGLVSQAIRHLASR